MSTSDYFTQAMTTLEQSLKLLPMDVRLKRIVCFGIGPFTRNFQALHQLAFILEAQKHFEVNDSFYFDPIFRDSEKTVLERLKCTIMQENCEAKYAANVVTLFYLPHCPNCLTNNLLWCNWQPELLKNVVLVNNSFDSLASSKPERLLRLDSGYVLDVLPYVKEFPLEDEYKTHNVFNDLSVHVFPPCELPLSVHEFWTQKEAPTYKDVEMISAEDFRKLTIA